MSSSMEPTKDTSTTASSSSNNSMSTTMAAPQYLRIIIENAHLQKNHQTLGVGKMDPFVTLSLITPESTAPVEIARTPTHWDAHFEPAWCHECPPVELPLQSTYNDKTILQFVVYNDSSLGAMRRMEIARCQLTVQDLLRQHHDVVKDSKKGSLGLKSRGSVAGRLLLPLSDDNGTLTLEVQVKDATDAATVSSSLSSSSSARPSSAKIPSVTRVDPSWFESPVTRLGVSGGTAPFFRLVLTPTGMQATGHTSPEYYLGKDLSHAQDERDFYEKILHIRTTGEESKGAGLLVPFMFEYLGILETKVDNHDDHDKNDDSNGKVYQLLVLQNLRHGYVGFRMLDLKMGQQTAQGGWQGKSRLAAMKQSVLDGMTNSSVEGYRLEGFDGHPLRVTSMDPLLDILAIQTLQPSSSENNKQQQQQQDVVAPTTLWGRKISEKEAKKARRIFLQTLTGAQIFRLFMDLHLEQEQPDIQTDLQARYMSVEVAEIVLHELVSRLIRLAVTCSRLQVPQKWLGSSVALGFDCGLYPSRGTGDDAEHAIRSKVITNVFDWGRSELLTQRRYQGMTEAEQADRQRFWDNYKKGMYRLAYNATREYYHHFTNSERWTELTLKVMDFDSMKPDDYMGQVTLTLPDQQDTNAMVALAESQPYELRCNGKACGTVYCSISWLEFPAGSRLRGSWRVKVERATNLPVKDVTTATSDPYCIVIARDASSHREVSQMTCVKTRNLNPQWNEIIDVPVMKQSSNDLTDALTVEGVDWDWSQSSSEIIDKEMARLFKVQPPDENCTVREWSTRLQFSH